MKDIIIIIVGRCRFFLPTEDGFLKLITAFNNTIHIEVIPFKFVLMSSIYPS